MEVELFLILSATYEYTVEPMPGENADANRLRRYIRDGIVTYMQGQGYVYDAIKHEWIGRQQEVT